MFGLFKKSRPTQTTWENVFWLPHIESVFLWFLKNDFQLQQIISPSIATLFEEGYRPQIDLDNNPEILEKASEGKVSIKYAHSWLWARLSMDIINLKRNSGTVEELKKKLESTLDALFRYGDTTLTTCGNIVHEYNIDPLVKNLETELAKIPTLEEKENFKQNYLADTLTAAEIRILAWIYKELFDKDYKVKLQSSSLPKSISSDPEIMT